MKNIVVYLRSQSRYGDQIVSYPTLLQLKTWWPKAHLRVVSKYNVGGYYTNLPWVDEFIQVQSFFDYVKAQPRLDCISVNLHHSSERYGLVNMLRLPKMRLGFKNARLTDFIWTHSHRKTIEEYIGQANLKILSEVVHVDTHAITRQCFETIAAQAQDRIQPADIVFIPGGGSGEFKRWSWRHYVRLSDMLKQRLGDSVTFTFVLGPSEQLELQNLSALKRRDFRLEYGRTIPELAQLMLGARLVVANDCGPSHIAQGLCVPYVGIFNEPNPEWFWARPYTRDVVPLDRSAGINSIEPERAFQACLAVLAYTRSDNLPLAVPDISRSYTASACPVG